MSENKENWKTLSVSDVKNEESKDFIGVDGFGYYDENDEQCEDESENEIAEGEKEIRRREREALKVMKLAENDFRWVPQPSLIFGF
jgi:hypothetical protein